MSQTVSYKTWSVYFIEIEIMVESKREHLTIWYNRKIIEANIKFILEINALY